MTTQIHSVAACLLPEDREPTGTYPPEVYIRASAFRVLAHAEIESYIEDRSWELALATIKAWKAGQRESRTILCLTAYCGLEMKAPPDSIRPRDPSQTDTWAERADLSKRMDAVVGAMAHVISHNHGIKEENLLRLLLPIGISISQLDPVLVADMNSFSERRGEAAHSSASARRKIDPTDDLSAVSSIVNGLLEIDALIDALLEPVIEEPTGGERAAAEPAGGEPITPDR